MGSKTLSPTLKDYLEAISRLTRGGGGARVRDIAAAVSVHKSTVTAALKSLAEKNLVNYAPYEVTTLTPQGRRQAGEVARRHEVIRSFLRDILQVGESAADSNACRMEHVVDKRVLDRLALFARFVKACPRAGAGWLEHFRYYFEHGGQAPHDQAQLERWLHKLERTVRRQMREKADADSG